jgi:hypothetical protein
MTGFQASNLLDYQRVASGNGDFTNIKMWVSPILPTSKSGM